MTPTRALAPAALVSAVLRAVPWRPVVSLAGAGFGLLLVGAAWPGSLGVEIALTLSLPLLAASTAYLLDEAATEAVAAAPVTLRARSSTRLVLAGLPWVGGAAGLAVLAVRSQSGILLAVVVQLTGCLVLACAASAIARRSMAEPGETVAGAMAGLLVGLTLVNPFARWVDLFPTQAGQRWGGSLAVWAAVVLVCLALGVRATRDPLA